MDSTYLPQDTKRIYSSAYPVKWQ